MNLTPAQQTKLEKPESYRQSLLAAFETCPRRTRFELEKGNDFLGGYTEASADLGKLFHEVAAEILRTLWRQGEEQIPTQEAVEIMYEVSTKSDVVLPSAERDDLRWMVLKFCDYRWDARRIVSLEDRLETAVVCQDGKQRTLNGTPDLIVAEPPEGLIIVDYKTGRAVPRTPREKPPEGEAIKGKQYLSDRGHFQLDLYSLLAMRTWPQAQYAKLRELHLRSGEVREAVLAREELEHVERELGAQMMKLERGLLEGKKSEVWYPRPGKHCLRQCPVARSCPIPVEQRGDGAVGSSKDADIQAEEFAVTDALRQQLRNRLKAYHEETGDTPRLPDGNVMRWKTDPETGKRAFGMHKPEEANA